MKNKITRRDFLNGTQIAIGASLMSPALNILGGNANQFSLPNSYYPPAKTGLRGSHKGSWETMHARVFGEKWEKSKPEEIYDLVIVGAGISGLSAAHFYRKHKPDAKILILDNHDDFGGHAKRNEFSINGGIRTTYGGTESIDTPSSYSNVAKELLVDIGIDVQKFYKAFHQELYPGMGLSKSIVFDKETFGEQKIVVGYNKLPWEEFIKQTPLTSKAKKDFLRLWTEKKDYLPHLSKVEKFELLKNMSYNSFLRDIVKVDNQVLEIFRRWGMSFWCVGSDEIPATAVQSYDGGMPGLNETLKRDGHRGDEPYIFHFPDGNASVARLIVRSLIPSAVSGSTMEDIVTTKIDYSKLDQSYSDTKIRLNSTVVNVEHTSNEKHVDITFVRNGRTHTVRSSQCIMACYNGAIPYLCSELPKAQKDGLAYGVKAPLTYTKVLIKNWRSFAELGTDFVYYTNGFHKQVELDYPVSIGDYKFGKSPNDPMVLHMCHVPYFADIQGPDQWRAGRNSLMQTSFQTFEDHVKDQLDQALSSTGFDSEKEIQAITVNRWSHGYAYNPDLIWEPNYKSESDKPWVIGRQSFGRIHIANSDAGAQASTKTAINQAWRAVQES
ncbi:MAG: NAD(P)-binding protein, partial [Gammaproteobacteria bacterium]|nr:NAD(P)-binding protein [Gammaproteobacteria bacterium]